MYKGIKNELRGIVFIETYQQQGLLTDGQKVIPFTHWLTSHGGTNLVSHNHALNFFSV
jgi:hypothetical protein